MDRVVHGVPGVGRRDGDGLGSADGDHDPAGLLVAPAARTTGGTAPGPSCSRPCSARYLGEPARMLDVGSADGPSVGWMRGTRPPRHPRPFPSGLVPGEGVCGLRDGAAVRRRGLRRGGGLRRGRALRGRARAVASWPGCSRPGAGCCSSVPAYQWAWSDHDVRAGHHRRYTRPRLWPLVEEAGLLVERSTYAFWAVFPFFVAERLARRVKQRAGRPPHQGCPPSRRRLDQLLIRLSRSRPAAAAAAEPTLRLVGPARGLPPRTPGRRPSSVTGRRRRPDVDDHQGDQRRHLDDEEGPQRPVERCRPPPSART